jgi:hypothetical protein
MKIEEELKVPNERSKFYNPLKMRILLRFWIIFTPLEIHILLWN